MSRISRYQESIKKFIINKSCIKDIDEKKGIKNIVLDMLSKSNNMLSIIMITILNNQSKEQTQYMHGFYIACSIELLTCIMRILDGEIYYEKLYGKKKIDVLINQLILLSNMSINQNMTYMQVEIKKEKMGKVMQFVNVYMNNKIFDIIDDEKIDFNNFIKKTDLLKYEYKKVENVNILISNFRQIKKEYLLEYIKKKYGSMCQISIVLGWVFGGDKKIIADIDNLGIYLGYMIKIIQDLTNLEEDMGIVNDYTFNYIINYGIQDAFELFINNKLLFIEKCMMNDIYTNTIKEVLDLLELQLDEFINKIPSELKSEYTIP